MKRAATLSDIYIRARDAAARAGVTRLADATGFDRIGIPVAQAIRPGGRMLSVSQGKGRTLAGARVSALMEAIEADCAERIAPVSHRIATEAERSQWADAAQPALDAVWQRPIGWVRAVDQRSGQSLLVPHGFVSMDCADPDRPSLGAITTGIGAGSCPVEAIVVGLAELLERAACARFWALDPAERRALEVGAAHLPGRTMRWARTRIARSGMLLRLWDLTSLAGVPTYLAVLFDVEQRGPPLPPALGQCCRFTAADAAFGAIAEAAQARVTLLAGARDDITAEDYADANDRMARLLLGTLSITGSTASPAPSPAPPREWQEAECRLNGALEAAGASALLCVDLAPPAIAGTLAVVKMLAPGIPDSARRP